jgi:hypothetical protein
MIFFKGLCHTKINFKNKGRERGGGKKKDDFRTVNDKNEFSFFVCARSCHKSWVKEE